MHTWHLRHALRAEFDMIHVSALSDQIPIRIDQRSSRSFRKDAHSDLFFWRNLQFCPPVANALDEPLNDLHLIDSRDVCLAEFGAKRETCKCNGLCWCLLLPQRMPDFLSNEWHEW